VKSVSFTDGALVFTLPGRGQNEQRYEARLENDRLAGKTPGPQGREIAWEGRRAPDLKRSAPPAWGQPVALFNGKDLEGWRPHFPQRPNGWAVQEGRLVNATPGNDLVTQRTFTDFQLHAEFRYPKGSNSGIYLRGRYELQIEDSFGQDPESHGLGSIYGFLAPRVNAAKPAGEWQICDVTLVGRMVTVTLNGEKILDNQEIPGITGGALDSDEGAPGPIYLQGDHGPVEFRNMNLTPAK
jgi:3-keto-disaccharide hydrolase